MTRPNFSVFKCQQFDVYENKEKQRLDNYNAEAEGEVYVLVFFIVPFLSP